MTAIDRHPQRAEIITQLLNGTALRRISASIVPPVHHTVLSRFKTQMLSEATKNMRGVSPKSQVIKALASGEGAEDYRAQIKTHLENELADRAAKRSAREADAESAQKIDPLTGEVRHNMDHAALGRYDANGLRDIELRAKLAGILDSGTETGIGVKAVIMMPGTGLVQSGAPAVAVGVEVKLTK